MNNLLIREASINDLEPLHRLYSHVDQIHNDAHPEQFKPSGEIKRPNTYFEKLLSDENTKLLVAVTESKIIGFVHAELNEMNHPVFYNYLYGHVSDVVVSPKFKRRGVGKILFQAVEQWFKDKGVKEISLTVFSFNSEAKSFYQANGFKKRHCNMVKSLA